MEMKYNFMKQKKELYINISTTQNAENNKVGGNRTKQELNPRSMARGRETFLRVQPA